MAVNTRDKRILFKQLAAKIFEVTDLDASKTKKINPFSVAFAFGVQLEIDQTRGQRQSDLLPSDQ